ncbi:MAG TPA: glucokinase [Kineobactrum sp.]
MRWNLIADIGGTNARFAALLDGELESQFEFHHSVHEYPAFSDLIVKLREELATIADIHSAPTAVCLGVACPADTEQISFTNSHWSFTRKELMQWLGCEQIAVINDFEAVAHGITALNPADYLQIGGEPPIPNKAIGLIGAGTGLGMAALLPVDNDYHVFDTEGGHADFAPVDPLQIHVLNYLRAIYGRVSLERLLSGKGLLNLYHAMCDLHSAEPVLTQPADVVAASLAQTNPLALAALNVFCEAFGATAGNLALTLGARGGVYIAGGVIPRFSEFFIASGFRDKFENKGRFRAYLQPIPVFLVTRDNLGLLGAAKYLQRRNPCAHS